MKLSKKEKVIGIVLAALLFLITLSSTWFFLGQMKVSLPEWVVMNSCSPTSYLYLVCFVIFLITRKSVLLPVAFLPIWFLGTMAMFYVPWNADMMIAHVGHIIMTLNLAWVVWTMVSHREYKSLATGLLISIVWSVPYITYVLANGNTI